MEKRGVPAMLVATDAFQVMAEFEAKSLGLPDVEVLVVPHPIVTKTREELDAEVEPVLAQVRAFFSLPAGDGA
jgi:hypothetical protein